MNCPLDYLLLRAFGIGRHQLAGPEWLTTKIQIVARVPAGATAEQGRAMLRNLLVQRFKLVFHWTKEERRGFELAVAKDGAKLTESAGPEQAPAPGSTQQVNLPGKTAIRVGVGIPTNGVMSLTNPQNLVRTVGRRATMEELVQQLSDTLGQTVVDATGLKSKYDFALMWSPGAPPPPTGADVAEASEPQPTLADALRTLGLKLEAKRVVVEVLVIDQGARIPIEN
jgi:uncharacterized protein (TIGR03435 family)